LDARPDATFVYKGVVDESSVDVGSVNVKVPEWKKQCLAASCCSNILSGICTTLGVAQFWSRAGWYLLASDIGLFTTGQFLYFAAADPPDFDYKMLVQPVQFDLPELDSLRADGGQKLAYESHEASAVSRALLGTIEKYKGASITGDTVWQTIQLQSARSYSRRLEELFSELEVEWDKVQSLVGPLDSTSLQTAKQYLEAVGLPDLERRMLERFGFSQEQMDTIASSLTEFPDDYLLDGDVVHNLFAYAASTMTNLCDSLPTPPGEAISCTIDIVPETLLVPLEAGTLVRCFIELEGRDVMAVQPLSIILNDCVRPITVSNTPSDYDSDGIVDREVIFDALAILWQLPNHSGTNLMMVSGLLAGSVDASPFVGTDFTLVMPRYSRLRGRVVTDDNTGIAGVTVDVSNLQGQLLMCSSTNTTGSYSVDAIPAGEYSVSVVTPLGYQTENEVVSVRAFGRDMRVDFALSKMDITPRQRSRAYWASQLNRALAGRPQDYTKLQFSKFGSLIAQHFNGNPLNPVENYVVPQQATQDDSLKILSRLLNFQYFDTGEPFLKRIARGELVAMMLNVVAGKVSQTHVVTKDGMTLSQAITYCDMLVNDLECPVGVVPAGYMTEQPRVVELMRYIKASYVAGLINVGVILPEGTIPPDIVNIAYRYVSQSKPLPADYALDQNRPNPFNLTTDISFSHPVAGQYTLTIYNVMGQVVKEFMGYSEAGTVDLTWDATGMASGVYLYRLQVGEFSETKKMMLLK
jgi:hypothetical protein